MDETQYQKLLDDCKSYLNTRYDLLRLSLLAKLSKILGLILLAIVVVLSFGALALVFVLAQWLPLWASLLIIGGVFLLLLVLAILFRKQLFVNPLIGTLSTILFADNSTGEEVSHD